MKLSIAANFIQLIPAVSQFFQVQFFKLNLALF
jgi:hypothetical protein